MTDLIDLRGFHAEVSAIAGRLDALQERVGDPSEASDRVAREALEELQQTVEELRVSQEELTTQNEALAESRHTLEEERDRYRSLFLDAPVAYLVTDLRGVVTQANRAAITLLNVDERFLLHKPLATFVVPSHRMEIRQSIGTVTASGERSRGEWDVQPRRLPPLPASFELALLRSAARGDSLLWLIQDLSTERSLLNRAARLTAELSRSGDGESEADRTVRHALNELVLLLLDEHSLDQVMTRGAEVGRAVIPGAAGVSVSLFEQGRPRVGGVSAAWVRAVDEAQYELQEGPCVASLADGVWHAADDLDQDQRWPRFAAAASAQGILSALSVPLLVRGARLGVLNIYGSTRSAFTGDAVGTAERLAEVASVLVANAQVLAGSRRLAAELEAALVSRATVDMAKGILMARLNLDPDTAFEALRDLSQRRHMKLRDLAAELVAAPAR